MVKKVFILLCIEHNVSYYTELHKVICTVKRLFFRLTVMASIILTLALLCPSIVAQTLVSQTCNLQRTATIQSGAQAIIGGVIKIHEKGSNGYGCGVPTGSKWNK